MENMEIKNYCSGFYNGKKVLITGHTGFKGSWLSIWLHAMEAKVIGYALDPYTERDNFVLSGLSEKIIDIRGDIRDKKKLEEVFFQYQPEIVFHLAAQPLVRLSYETPVETYEINLMGTINILEAIRKSESVKAGVMITTDKCYENKEQIYGYRETDPLGGYDPYSSSKAACEIAIASWRNSFFNPKNYAKHGKSIASARAGNVIGGGDWAQDRIVPDCIRALEVGKPVEIRNPQAIRPWQHVLDPLSGYLLLAQKMWENQGEYCETWNFGPNQDAIANVWRIATSIVNNYGQGNLIDISNSNDLHETQLLSLDIAKAKYFLGWNPGLNLESTAKFTTDWYLKYKTEDVYFLCLEQIKTYLK
jgi:CDP-glucose 4,6-dehydratase